MTPLQYYLQGRRRLVLILPIVGLALLLAAGLYQGSIPQPPLPKVVFGDSPENERYDSGQPQANDLPSLIRALWAPVVLPITAPSFTTIDGLRKQLPRPNHPIHATPLGKRVCVLDVDNRGFDDEGGIFSNQLPVWDRVNGSTAGFLSHYLFAAIHGYTYKFVRAPKYADRAPHWAKVVFVKEMLKRYDIVLMMDGDAVFTTPQVPLEWLLNYWQIGPETLVAMPEDPALDPNWDIRHRANVNSGFIIAQASDLTQRLFEDWAECPSEKRYPGCAEWKTKPFHEQSAFSSFVRYDFLDGYSIDTHPQYIRHIPCSDANGYPEVAHYGCLGHFVRHFWQDKNLTVPEFTHNVMGALAPILAHSAYRQGGHVEDYRDMVLDGAELLGGP
ncbi:uncharacterized protein C8A04DRAFT_32944 [Dichotomopilus funicola]|uniref:Nucleotide-diphospho-sugar transferase domain-containing protein n=1 Tax=Dichotomopilus funicola TaxID=1934379 RepID=A0AAN6UVG5_9PEZI|nr:hypothetical protein C8A04DRAFT_32944 [Dichotomopilus funicola]